MVLQVWRHRPSAGHFAVHVEDGVVVGATGPMTPAEAVEVTQTDFRQEDSDPTLVATLNREAPEYDPVWGEDRGEYTHETWMGIMLGSGELE